MLNTSPVSHVSDQEIFLRPALPSIRLIYKDSVDGGAPITSPPNGLLNSLPNSIIVSYCVTEMVICLVTVTGEEIIAPVTEIGLDVVAGELLVTAQRRFVFLPQTINGILTPCQ